MTNDNLNRNGTYKYDWRNLLTEIRSIKTENGLFGPEDVTYWTLYKYDEAGNRIFKLQYKYIVSTPPEGYEDSQPGDSLVVEQGDGNGYWLFQYKSFYVRDIAGKEIAIYQGSDIEQWNIYGLDNIGRISGDNKRYFYLKDHLGSIRAVLDTTNTVVSAHDYDAWGYPLENRNWQSGQSVNQRYKFTGKERDNENNYDYFGARYYDSRIGRWGGVEPLYNQFISLSSYCYSFLNPIVFKDADGFGPKISINGNQVDVTFDFYYVPESYDSQFGLDANQINTLNDFCKNISDYWSGSFEIGNNSYNFNVAVNIHEEESKYSAMEVKTNKLDSYNRVANANGLPVNSLVRQVIESQVGVGILENTLYLLNGENLKPYSSTGAHEAGHAMGLSDRPSPDSGSFSVSPNIMSPAYSVYDPNNKSYTEVRSKPTSGDWQAIFKANNIDPTVNGTYNIDLSK